MGVVLVLCLLFTLLLQASLAKRVDIVLNCRSIFVHIEVATQHQDIIKPPFIWSPYLVDATVLAAVQGKHS